MGRAAHFFHGTVSHLNPGDEILPLAEVHKRGIRIGIAQTHQWEHVAASHGVGPEMPLEDGTKVHRQHLVYLTDTPHGAQGWAEHGLLKNSPEDFNRLHDEGMGALRVYKVEPINPRRPAEGQRHSPDEWVADKARVIGVHSESPIDRYCRQADCGDYLDAGEIAASPRCPSCNRAHGH